ncbi:unnamed protein product [Rotaria socialis]|uniref:HAT C-terminal dimerisation domain-containing protein n=1 Tax=Rotaria socialis TaxID=392032 RepID=A0A817ZBX4_9BILA|nr:unnamed protein product [Rotaria socialis]
MGSNLGSRYRWKNYHSVAHVTGTGGMQKHIESCGKISKNRIEQKEAKITQYFNSSENKSKDLSIKQKNKITNALAEFVVLDGRSFETLNGLGFINLIECVLTTGRTLLESSNMNANDLIADSRTISRNIDKMYEKRKSQLITLCKSIKSFVITVDFWSERKLVNSILEEFGLSLCLSSYIVSDNENKMRCAFNDVKRRGCSDHYLNKIPEKTFTDEKNIELQEPQKMFHLIKEIAEHVRRTHRQNKLTKKLQTFSKTRLNGKQLLNQLCDFLIPFDEVIEKLSDEQRPTIHLVLPLREYLIKYCIVHEDDENCLIAIKKFIENQIMTMWIPQDEHYLATILHPNFKQFDKNPYDKSTAMKLLQNEINNQTKSLSSLVSLDASCSTSIATTVSKVSSGENNVEKRKKNLLSLCFDDRRPSMSNMDEFTSWMSCNLTLDDKENDDLLGFWSKNSLSFPIISTIVRDIFAISASNTTVERTFSISKNLITDKRTRLGTEKVNQMIFLRKNLITLKDLFDHDHDKHELESNHDKRKNDDAPAESLDKNSKKSKVDENDEIVIDEVENNF